MNFINFPSKWFCFITGLLLGVIIGVYFSVKTIEASTISPILSEDIVSVCTNLIEIRGTNSEGFQEGDEIYLVGTGNCSGNVSRAVRFTKDGENIGETSGKNDHMIPITVEPGEHVYCFEITLGSWESASKDCETIKID